MWKIWKMNKNACNISKWLFVYKLENGVFVVSLKQLFCAIVYMYMHLSVCVCSLSCLLQLSLPFSLHMKQILVIFIQKWIYEILFSKSPRNSKWWKTSHKSLPWTQFISNKCPQNTNKIYLYIQMKINLCITKKVLVHKRSLCIYSWMTDQPRRK